MRSNIPNEEELRHRITYGHADYKPYPAEVIDDVLWLRGYTRRHCDNNDLDKLVEHARQKGFSNGANFFYQILTGKYFQPDPKKPGGIIGSTKNLRELCVQLAVVDRFATMLAKTRFVETPTFHKINDYIQRKRTPFNTCRFGIIQGTTGNQKSESFREILRREKEGVGFHMEMPAQPSLNLFVHKLGCLMGAGMRDTVGTKRNIIRERMNHERFVIFDNAQRGYNPRTGEVQPIFDYIQELQDDTQFTPILSVTPVAKKFLAELQNEYFEQFLGRTGGERDILRLDPFPGDEDIELICSSFRLSAAEITSLMPHMRALIQEKGRVRILFSTLQESARLANIAKQDLTAKHVLKYLGK